MSSTYKKYSKKKRYGRKVVPWYKRKYSPIDMAAKAMSGVNYLRKLINVERKFNDTVYAEAKQTTTPVITWISDISQGTDYNQREGLSVKLASLQFKGTVYASDTVSGLGARYESLVRVIIFCDMEGGSGFSAADLLEASTNINSPLNHTNGKRFIVYHDKYYTVSSGGPSIKEVKVFRKNNEHIRWSNSTTGQREGHLYVLTMSDETVSDNEPSISWYARIRYIDN